jgi:aspartate carbamoyltransferase catalytic subunit
MISSKNVTSKYIENLFKKADMFKKTPYMDKWKNKVMVNAFCEPNDHASLSFESAMYRLGGRVIKYSDTLDANKNGSIQDTIKTLSNYGDIMTLHHRDKEIYQYANHHTTIPIINTSDRNGDNPIQGLTDLYTIYSNLEMDTKHVKLLFIGDVKQSPSIHSLLHLLKNFIRIQINFLPYKGKEPHYSVLSHVSDMNEQIIEDIMVETNSVYFGDYDVIYCAPMQSDPNSHARTPEFIVDKELLIHAKDAIIMHPFPRNSELSIDLDDDKRSHYFEQLQNGLYIRMALIDNMLEGETI